MHRFEARFGLKTKSHSHLQSLIWCLKLDGLACALKTKGWAGLVGFGPPIGFILKETKHCCMISLKAIHCLILEVSFLSCWTCLYVSVCFSFAFRTRLNYNHADSYVTVKVKPRYIKLTDGMLQVVLTCRAKLYFVK